MKWVLQGELGTLPHGLTGSGWNLSPDEPGPGDRASLDPVAERITAGQKPLSILLVEDNPADVTLVREALDEHAVEADLIVISNGEDAFRFIDAVALGTAACPSLIILDLNLPRRSGREILAHFRKAAGCTDVPVVILTSSDAPRDREQTAALGATHYIRKPSNLEEFMAIGALLKAMLGVAGRS
jgi:CheY-like chemotaxis protein